MKPNQAINITRAKLLEDFQIQLEFDDGVTQVVHFKPFLQSSPHPEIQAFLQPEQFAQFRLQHGELVWGDYALCFPIMDLYHDCIMPRKHEYLAA